MTDTKAPMSSELGQFIPSHYHHLMLTNRARTGAFKEAIDRIVQPGDKVVELGGGTGILSFFAAQRASRVWCVELNPDLYRLAGKNLPLNRGSERIELVAADAATYVPPEPVDVVICEMLHSALLREKQLHVLSAFKAGYLAKFGPPLPRLIPEAVVLAVQPVQQPFEFFGYQCPLPVFQDPAVPQPATVELADPVAYATIDFAEEFPLTVEWGATISITRDGQLTALRFLTKALVGIFTDEGRSVDWPMSHVLLPVPAPFHVRAGAAVRIAFAYPAGGPLGSLADSLRVEGAYELRIGPGVRQATVRGCRPRPG